MVGTARASDIVVLESGKYRQVDEKAEHDHAEEQELRSSLYGCRGHRQRKAYGAQTLHGEYEHDAARDEVEDHVEIDE